MYGDARVAVGIRVLLAPRMRPGAAAASGGTLVAGSAGAGPL